MGLFSSNKSDVLQQIEYIKRGIESTKQNLATNATPAQKASMRKHIADMKVQIQNLKQSLKY